jgi:hypothetical protein
MFWHSIAEILTQNFNQIRRNRNLQKWPINVNKLVYFDQRLYIDEVFDFLFPYFRVIEEQQLTYSTHSPENSFEFVKIDDCENFDIQVKQEKLFHPIM